MIGHTRPIPLGGERGGTLVAFATALAVVLVIPAPVAAATRHLDADRGAQERPASAFTGPAGVRFERVDVTRDVPFVAVRDADGAEVRLALDVYQPAGDPAPVRPAIVWVHGGGFRPGVDKRQGYIVTLATAFAKRGYVSIAPDYRVRAQPDRDRPGTIRDAVADVQAARGWLLRNSGELRVSPQRIAVAGGSAGGRTTVGLVTAEDAASVTFHAPRPCAAVVLWGSPDASYQLAPPSSRFPPTLLIHGTKDVTVPYEHSERLAATLRSQGVDTVLLPLPGAAHTPVEHIDLIVETIARFLERVCAPAPTP
jgi:acetyl esterase/lipase